jgi:hypothetical protein
VWGLDGDKNSEAPKQVIVRASQGLPKAYQGGNTWIPLAGLQLLNVPQADVRFLGQFLLRESGGHPLTVQILSKGTQVLDFHPATIPILGKG